MNLPDKLYVIAVPYPWYRAIKAHYIVSGSKSVNCWTAGGMHYLKDVRDLEPGTLTVFEVILDGHQLLCGGGFYFRSMEMEPEHAWDVYGVNNGAESYDDFLNQIGESGWKQGENITAHVLNGAFAFSRKESFEMPEELPLDLKTGQMKIFGLDEPEGRFIAKVIMHRRSPHLRPGTNNNEWPGIYLMAAEKHAFDYSMVFSTKMLCAYGFRCAITGDATTPLLDVAHIRTFYDERFTKPENGIVMRNDLHRLFSLGYVTCVYASDDEVKVKVSKRIAAIGGRTYLKYDGSSLRLPEDRSQWPSREYLKWHNQRRFENWLKSGALGKSDGGAGTML